VGAAQFYIVGAHGGAGVSTVAALTGGYDVGPAWPHTGGPVLLCARTSYVALQAARFALRDVAAGGVPHVQLLGLVLIADAPGRLPRELRGAVKKLQGATPHLWAVPWHPPWRLGATPDADNAPRAVRRLMRDLLYLVPDLNDANPLELTTGSFS
jgi:hypothetical protein